MKKRDECFPYQVPCPKHAHGRTLHRKTSSSWLLSRLPVFYHKTIKEYVVVIIIINIVRIEYMESKYIERNSHSLPATQMQIDETPWSFASCSSHWSMSPVNKSAIRKRANTKKKSKMQQKSKYHKTANCKTEQTAKRANCKKEETANKLNCKKESSTHTCPSFSASLSEYWLGEARFASIPVMSMLSSDH